MIQRIRQFGFNYVLHVEWRAWRAERRTQRANRHRGKGRTVMSRFVRDRVRSFWYEQVPTPERNRDA